MLPESLTDEGHVATVFGDRLRPNQDVIDVNMAKATDIFVEHPVHEPLEGSDSVAEAMGHDHPFE